MCVLLKEHISPKWCFITFYYISAKFSIRNTLGTDSGLSTIKICLLWMKKKCTFGNEHVTIDVTTVNIIVFIAVNIILHGGKKNRRKFILNDCSRRRPEIFGAIRASKNNLIFNMKTNSTTRGWKENNVSIFMQQISCQHLLAAAWNLHNCWISSSLVTFPMTLKLFLTHGECLLEAPEVS